MSNSISENPNKLIFLIFVFRFLEDFSLADVIEIADDERHHKSGDQVILLWKYGKEAIVKGAACLI